MNRCTARETWNSHPVWTIIRSTCDDEFTSIHCINMQSFYEEVDGARIHYEKVGTGQQVLILLPGGLGTPRSNFSKQLDGGLDQSLFTIIAIDLPGWGKSRPPERIYNRDTLNNDVRIAAGLMDKLGYKLYSVLGWCQGGRVALLLSVRYQARVDKLVVWGVAPHATERYIRSLSRFREMSSFDSQSLEMHSKVYGLEIFERLWHQLIDYELSHADNPLDLWDVRKDLRHIRCPTLILHGDEDPLIENNLPPILEKEIAESRLVRFTKGSHNIHQAFDEEFNKLVTNFLLEVL